MRPIGSHQDAIRLPDFKQRRPQAALNNTVSHFRNMCVLSRQIKFLFQYCQGWQGSNNDFSQCSPAADFINYKSRYGIKTSSKKHPPSKHPMPVQREHPTLECTLSKEASEHDPSVELSPTPKCHPESKPTLLQPPQLMILCHHNRFRPHSAIR
jgi:hypothetical protein